MFQTNIIESNGTRTPLFSPVAFARRAVASFNFRKKRTSLSPVEKQRLELATIRETSPEEVTRRMELIKQLRG